MREKPVQEWEIRELYSPEDIRDAVGILAKSMADDYQRALSTEKDFKLVLVGVLNGAVPFIGDLARALSRYFLLGTIELDYIAISSYRGRRQGLIRLEKDTKEPLEGKHVLVVEDIIDSGKTLKEIAELISAKHPRSIRFCVLVSRHKAQKRPVEPNYVGFTVCKPYWLIGYGLDYNGFGRALPFIGYIVDP